MTLLPSCAPPARAAVLRPPAGWLGALHPGMILLADRNFGGQQLVAEVSATGADLLVRVRNGRRLPVCLRCRL
jgi:hypothetical protein